MAGGAAHVMRWPNTSVGHVGRLPAAALPLEPSFGPGRSARLGRDRQRRPSRAKRRSVSCPGKLVPARTATTVA